MRKIFPIPTARALLVRTALFALLWAVLTEGEGFVSVWTLPGIGVGVIVSFLLWPSKEWKWRFRPAVRFIPYFFWHSFLGGVDVAKRALSPRIQLRPEIIDFPFILEKEPARVVFLWAVSLLPGTAGVDLQANTARIHILDTGIADVTRLRVLESRIAAMFDQQISTKSREAG